MIRPLESPSAPSSSQVLVLGMHRSGTSALTGLLSMMGLFAGETHDLPPADRYNQTGYWEHRRVLAIDEEILRLLGATWSDIAQLDLDLAPATLLAPLRESARALVAELNDHAGWVIKDPRLCVLLPFWRPLLDDPFFILLYREPLPVARSLAARDGLAISHGIALWEKYTREALVSTIGMPRILVSHRALIADPENTLARVRQSFLQHRPDLTHLQIPSHGRILDFLNPAFVHYHDEPELEPAYLNGAQLSLLSALADGSALELNPVPPLSAGAMDLLSFHGDAQRELAEARTRAQRALARQEVDERAVDELNALISAILESHSWKLGRALTRPVGFFRRKTTAAQRKELIMNQLRRWRKEHALSNVKP